MVYKIVDFARLGRAINVDIKYHKSCLSRCHICVAAALAYIKITVRTYARTSIKKAVDQDSLIRVILR